MMGGVVTGVRIRGPVSMSAQGLTYLTASPGREKNTCSASKKGPKALKITSLIHSNLQSKLTLVSMKVK